MNSKKIAALFTSVILAMPVLIHANETSQPNILLIISDDLGLDSSSQYNLSTDLPHTPTLDSLAKKGIVFDNAWATPACTTTRGTLITGLHGINSGIDTVPNKMDTSLNTIQRLLKNDAQTSHGDLTRCTRHLVLELTLIMLIRSPMVPITTMELQMLCMTQVP